VWWLMASVLAVVMFLILATLATMRETVLLRGQVDALQQLVKHPPAPSFALDGGALPQLVANAIRASARASESASDSSVQLVAFISQGCGPCDRLTHGLSQAVRDGSLSEQDLVFVMWGPDHAQAAAYGERLPGELIFDPDGDLQRAAEIRGTPTLLLVNRSDLNVIDYDLEGDVEWVITQFSSRRPLAPTT
jgi:hypothetical protein